MLKMFFYESFTLEAVFSFSVSVKKKKYLSDLIGTSLIPSLFCRTSSHVLHFTPRS